TDYTDVAGPTELAYNARIAANLGAPVMLVVSGNGRSPEEVPQISEVSVGELTTNHAQIMAVIANRCDPERRDEGRAALAAQVPAWATPADPFRTAPTVRQLMAAVAGRLMPGAAGPLGREVRDVLVGAMSIEHLLD